MMMQMPEYALTKKRRHILGGAHYYSSKMNDDADTRICPNGKKMAYSGQCALLFIEDE